MKWDSAVASAKGSCKALWAFWQLPYRIYQDYACDALVGLETPGMGVSTDYAAHLKFCGIHPELLDQRQADSGRHP